MHLGLQLDNKLSFNEYIRNEISKATKDIGLLPKLWTILPRRTSSTVYKSLIRPNLDHRDVICDQPFKASFSNKIESVLYNAAIAVAGANKAFLVINCVMTWVLSISTTEYGWGDCTYSTKSFQPSNHHIFLTYFPEWDILPDTLTLSMYFLIQLKHFKNISFLKTKHSEL